MVSYILEDPLFTLYLQNVASSKNFLLCGFKKKKLHIFI